MVFDHGEEGIPVAVLFSHQILVSGDQIVEFIVLFFIEIDPFLDQFVVDQLVSGRKQGFSLSLTQAELFLRRLLEHLQVAGILAAGIAPRWRWISVNRLDRSNLKQDEE